MNSRRFFQLFLVGFAAFSLIISSDVIHGGVTASVIRPLDVAPTGGGGGGGGGCNPNNYVLYGTRYTVKILDAETDRGEYAHGDTVIFTGTVQLVAEPVYINECYQYLVGDAYDADSSVVSVALSGPFGDLSAENNGQYFKAEVTVPLQADAGTVSYHITATYDSSSDATDVSFKVAEYVPVLTVKTWHGFVYPGEQFTVSGSNWKPDGDVALDYGGLGSGTGIVGPSGTFPEVTVAVPETQKDGPYTITGTEEGLEAHSNVVVRWRQLVVTIGTVESGPAGNGETGLSVQQGGWVDFGATVTDKEGKAVAGAVITITTSRGDVIFTGDATSSENGNFGEAALVGIKASPGTILVTVTAQKTPGYLMGTASLTMQVTCRPYGLEAAQGGSCTGQVTTPGNIGVAAAGPVAASAVATAVASGGDGEDPCADKEDAESKAKKDFDDKESDVKSLTTLFNWYQALYDHNENLLILGASCDLASMIILNSLLGPLATEAEGMVKGQKFGQFSLPYFRSLLASLDQKGAVKAARWAERAHFGMAAKSVLSMGLAAFGGAAYETTEAIGEAKDKIKGKLDHAKSVRDYAKDNYDHALNMLNDCHKEPAYAVWAYRHGKVPEPTPPPDAGPGYDNPPQETLSDEMRRER